MTPIDLDNHVLSRCRTLCLWRALPIRLGKVSPQLIRHAFHLGMVMDTTVMTIPLLQITLRFSVALPGPLFALPFGSIRMDGVPKTDGMVGKLCQRHAG